MQVARVVSSVLGLCIAITMATHVSAQTSLPYPDSHFKGFVGSTYLDSAPATFPQPVKAPKGAPNVLLILLDDVGFGQFAVTGGGVPSPTMEQLAKAGLLYNRFHTTALCSPTRAALLTGRNPQSSGTGIITELATGYDGYTGIIPQETATVAEVLRQNGYNTAWIGKNHNTPVWETSANGPYTHWATGPGFNYFYGFNAGDISQWEPILFENTNPVPRSTDQQYHLSTDLADKAIAWMRRSKEIEPEKPFFLYVAPAATHSPHHAPQAWIDKFKGQFDMGWDHYRELTFERQKKLGVIPANAVLTARPASLPAWESVPAAHGYATGVPMGGDLRTAPAGKAPAFMVQALRDPDGANLDRLQIIKGWLDAEGKTHERIWDVAVSDGRTIGPDGRCQQPVGNTVNVAEATYTNAIGDAVLGGYWRDPAFDRAQRAFYYVRVLEIPTPRWTTYDAKVFGVKRPEDVPASIQERAYTSPIWYTPGN
jgi:Protein of unknown function (DUF3604)/Sulfatase